MAHPDFANDERFGIEAILRDELVGSDRIRASAGPILRHLLRDDDRSVFSEETIARVRGILRDLARQLLGIADETGSVDPAVADLPPEAEIAALTETFTEIPALLGHVHALALEWHLTASLDGRLALDPVLSPLLQAQIASAQPDRSALAMLLLSAQARFMQHVRRMELAVTELPGDLFHIVLLALRSQAAHDPAADARAAAAESALRARYDERSTRLALLEQVIAAMGGEAGGALRLADAGVALFLTALAIGAGIDRDEATFSTTDSQIGRFALLLAASGARGADLAAPILALHPDVTLPEGLDALHPDRAAALLAEAALRQGH